MVKGQKKAASTQEGQLTYRQLLLQSQQDRDLEDVSYQEESKRRQLEADISETKYSLSNERKARLAMLRNQDIDFQQLAKKEMEIEGLERGVEKLEQYLASYFPS